MSNLVIDKQTKRYSRYTHSENEILRKIFEKVKEEN
jgi:hypothetical protein